MPGSEPKTLIFVPTIKLGKELQDYLRQKGADVPFFHSKLDNKSRMRIQNLFTGTERPELQILISTSAFGMGIDIPNIRHIVHLSPALCLTDYVQQIGRAGRDGEPSYAHLLYSSQDDGLLRFMAEQPLRQPGFQEKHGYSDADMFHVKNKLLSQVDDMLKLTHLPTGSEWQYIRHYFGETQFSAWQRYGKTSSLIILATLLAIAAMIVYPFFASLFLNPEEGQYTSSKPVAINNDLSTKPVSPRLDIEKIATALKNHQLKHGKLPTYEDITTPYKLGGSTRMVFFYGSEYLSFYREAHIVNTLENNRLNSGLSYYINAPNEVFDQPQPLPNYSNVHIFIGYKCQTETLSTYNLKASGKLDFAIVYKADAIKDVYRCLGAG